MNIFKRLFRIGQAEIHAAVDKMEDPIKMTEQGLRELRTDLEEATEAYAKVKALAIRTGNDQVHCHQESRNYGEKAILIMQKAQSGQVELMKAEDLAREALSLHKNWWFAFGAMPSTVTTKASPLEIVFPLYVTTQLVEGTESVLMTGNRRKFFTSADTGKETQDKSVLSAVIV